MDTIHSAYSASLFLATERGKLNGSIEFCLYYTQCAATQSMLITDVAFSQRSPLRTRRAAAGGCEEPDRRGKQYPSEAILLRRLLGSQQGAGVPGRPLSFWLRFLSGRAERKRNTPIFSLYIFSGFSSARLRRGRSVCEACVRRG